MADKKNEVAKLPTTKDITDSVLIKVNELKEAGELATHKNYNVENALKSAFLVLSETVDMNKKPVLQSCSRESIANTLLEMVTSGLNVHKKQCYFIPYAGKLTFSRSYLGAQTILKRDANGKSVTAQAIYKGDEFSFGVDAKTGIKHIIEHKQTLESLSTDVTGAYCIITFNDDSQHCEIMNIEQINKAWNQRKGTGLSPAHKNFADEMAKKTVINRACKPFINTIDDENIFDELEKQTIDIKAKDVKHEIDENANKESFNIEDAEIIEEKEPITKPVQNEKGVLFPEQQTENDAENEDEPF